MANNFTKIRDLVEACTTENINYVNLDTGRKNKNSSVLNKKDIHIDYYFRVFSSNKNVFETFVKGLSVAFPEIVAKKRDVNPIIKILTDLQVLAFIININLVQ